MKKKNSVTTKGVTTCHCEVDASIWKEFKQMCEKQGWSVRMGLEYCLTSTISVMEETEQFGKQGEKKPYNLKVTIDCTTDTHSNVAMELVRELMAENEVEIRI